jgi:hypothetical protein
MLTVTMLLNFCSLPIELKKGHTREVEVPVRQVDLFPDSIL